MNIPLDARHEYERFSLPLPDKTLAERRLRNGLGKPNSFSSMPRVLIALGTNLAGEFPTDTKKAHWAIHQKIGYKAPQFPSEDAEVDLGIALYRSINPQGEQEINHVVACVGDKDKPFNAHKFAYGVQALTRQYIERPFFSFTAPSTLNSRLDASIAAGLLEGLAIASLANFAAGEPSINSAGLIIGLSLLGNVVNSFGWQLAGGQIPDLGQYVADQIAVDFLQGLVSQKERVILKRELYDSIKGGSEISPDDFLTRIYSRLDPNLIVDRRREIALNIKAEESTVYPELVLAGNRLLTGGSV